MNQREFKFRAWDKKEKTMLEVGLLDCQRMQIIPPAPDDQAILERHDDIVLMQFTGLKDKNGKELYEGDILEWEAKPRCGRGAIEWGSQADEAKWLLVHEKSVWNLSALAHRIVVERIDGEIIGNIYENPELLKQNNN